MARTSQRGSATVILTVGVVLVVAVTVGAASFYMVRNNQQVETSEAVAAPLSPYDDLEAGDSNAALQSNVLNIDSGMQQEQLHLKGTDRSVNDEPNVITGT